MNKSVLTLCLTLSIGCAALPDEHRYAFDPNAASLSESLSRLAREVMEDYREDDRERYLDTFFRLQIVAHDFSGAVRSLRTLREVLKETGRVGAEAAYLQYEIFAQARLRQAADGSSFEEAFERVIEGAFLELDDRGAFEFARSLSYNLNVARRELQGMLDEQGGGERIGLADAIALVRKYQPLLVYESILALTEPAITADDRRRYAIEDEILIETADGARLSALVVRPRGASRLPAALMFNIYTDPGTNLQVAKNAAAHGYAGVVADPRGKRLSQDEILPWEHEATDTFSVIDWISRQSWNDGQVGMYGGSYNGFAAWAATKRAHPALKTIVAWVASIPGMGWPMHNNVFTNANYCWAFQITRGKLDAPEVCRDRERWEQLLDEWYASGRSYREIDQVDGAPNVLLQRWLRHPSYDEYWQRMVPFGSEFAAIDIPVLSVTGYYDDAQISALHYLREHHRHNEDAEHYLVIGPYDHWGAQWKSPPVVRGYRIDPVAQLDTYGLTFDWFDFVLRGAEKPPLLKDRINFQVMGANQWRHVASLEAASPETLTLYLSDARSDGYYRLTETRPAEPASLVQEVDFADRTSVNNDDFYPAPVIRESLEQASGLVFATEPFGHPIEISGAFSGVLKASINKADVDVGVTLYELTPEGTYFHLSYYLGRASYAKDMTTRNLLEPGKIESIPIARSYMTSRLVEKGSRLVVVLDVNKNPGYQINYGTGADVSDESIEDAGTPLRIAWQTDSRLEIPVSRPVQ